MRNTTNSGNITCYTLDMKKGRPTDYKPEYCEQLIEYFSGEPYRTVGNKMFPNRLPTLERFAVKIGVTPNTLLVWSKKHKDFKLAYACAKSLYKDFLNTNGALGLYNPAYSKFIAINTTDMVDEKKIKHDATPEFNDALSDKSIEELRRMATERGIIGKTSGECDSD